MNNKLKSMTLLALLGAITFTGCKDDEDTTVTPEAETAVLTLDVSGLEPLGDDFEYEGWIMVDGVPMSAGLFDADANGVLSQTSFTLDKTMLESATKYIITVEPSPDSDPAPSDQKLVAGDFDGNSAAISTSVAPALGDFSDIAGSFFLRTPTDEEDGMNNGNDEYGVWFGDPSTSPPSPALTLPTLPDGWAYEGWVVTENGPISTGTFLSADGRDDSNILSGTEANAGPPVPGEDFFNNAPEGQMFPLDVRGKTVVISIEPVPDNSPAPFLLKPLLSTLAADAGTAPTTHDFGQNLGTLPTGTATR